MAVQIEANKIILLGSVIGECTWSHSAHGENFWKIIVETVRLSGSTDISNVIIPERRLPEDGIKTGQQIRIIGQLRSYNNKSGTGNRLIITVYATEVQTFTNDDKLEGENIVLLSGGICTAPIFRKTPLGREICDIMLAVKRRCGRADYLPCIAWGAIARLCASLRVGERIDITGRFQSRGYIKKTDDGEEERMAFEISVITARLAVSDSSD